MSVAEVGDRPWGADGAAPAGAALLNRAVLVLNRHWIAIHVCTVRRALSLLFQNLAQVVADDSQLHDYASWRDLSALNPDHGPQVHTTQFAVRVPEVIVLARYNRVPPRRVKFNRRNIFLRDRFTCQYCGERPARDELTIDHVVPRSRGGGSAWDNVVVACVRCNTKKGDRAPEEIGLRLLSKPRRPHWLLGVHMAPGKTPNSSWQRFVDKAYWDVELEQ